MKHRKIVFAALVFIALSGCMVFSFYPLYTPEDLFPNKLLLGKWIDKDSTIWKFDYYYKGKKEPQNLDSTGYILTLKDKDQKEYSRAELQVRVVKLNEKYFLDFYLNEYFDNDNLTLFDFHVLPVHTIAKLELKKDSAYINWFDPDWLKKLIEENRIRIHHENNGEHILLTAKPQELQKFVIKYVNSEEAFKDGMDAAIRKLKE